MDKNSIRTVFSIVILIFFVEISSMRMANTTSSNFSLNKPKDNLFNGNATLDQILSELDKANGHMGTIISDMKNMKKEIEDLDNDVNRSTRHETYADVALACETLLLAVTGIAAVVYRKKQRTSGIAYEPIVNTSDIPTENNTNLERNDNNLLVV